LLVFGGAEGGELATAVTLGLATEAVPDADLTARSLELARRLAAGPPLALHAVRMMMRRAMEATLDSSLGDAQQAVLWVGPR
jgi:2-(1,2-epoxy-1,2-dihydrophenyl)acetyl-CoA isomerase